MLKIIMIYDQIQAGAGTKDDKMIPLAAKKEPVGPAVMMEPYLKEIGAKVVACLYCGNGYFRENESEVVRKLTAMTAKLHPDAVMCGPCFNYADYADMAAQTALSINRNTDVPAIAAMSEENEEVISRYKDQILIVKTPKKGGIGLTESLHAMCTVTKALTERKNTDSLKEEVCFH